MYIITVLTRNFLALLLLNSFTLSFILVLSRSHRNFLAHLLGLVLGHLLILCRALFLHICAALSLGNIFALLSGHLVALFLGDLGADCLRHLLAHLPWLPVAMLGRDGGSHWLLQIVTLLHWHQSANFLGDRCTNFLVHQLFVRCCVGSALCVGHLLTFFLGHMFTHLSRLVPAFLTWLIPAFFHTLHSDALLLSDGSTLFLSDSGAHLLVLGAALLGVLGNTHFLLQRLGNRLGYSLTLLLLSVVALLLGDHHTLGLVDVVDLCVLRRLAHLILDLFTLLTVHLATLVLILGRALLLTCCGTSLLRHIHTHFLWHRHYIGHRNSAALLLVVGDRVGLLHCVTLLPGLVPA